MLEVIDDFFKESICKTLEERLLINTFPWGYLSQSIPTPMQWPTHMLGPEPAGQKWPSEIPKDDFMFTHHFFQEVDDLHNQMAKESGKDERDYMVSPAFNIIEPTIKPIMDYFNFNKFEKIFDSALAFSLFTHLPSHYLKLCLHRLSKVFRSGSHFLQQV